MQRTKYLKPEPLTAAEKKWIKDLQAVFDRKPDRFEFATIGDANFDILDADLRKEYDIQIEDGGAERAGIVLGYINTKAHMHGVAG